MMKTFLGKYWTFGLSVLLGIGVFVFWFFCYPHALNYQEQYQLFLWSFDYFVERCSVPGGLSDWLGEFVVQFYYVPWIGALLLAILYVALQRVVWAAMHKEHYLLSFMPSVLLFWLMGDPSVLLGFLWALLLAVAADVLNPFKHAKGLAVDVLVVPLVYWIAGPLAWVYVLLRMFANGWKWTWYLPFLLFALQMLAYHLLLEQWPVETVFLPMQYYRIPLQWSSLMGVIPVITIVVVLLSKTKSAVWMSAVEGAMLFTLCWLGISKGYDKDTYALIRQDYLVRNERWSDIIKEAEAYQVKTPFSSVCVNLALSQKRLLADRMFDFYQSGEDALVMHTIGDLTSNLPSMEAMWRLGMVNATQRYAFNLQASILNARKSGRLTRRIAECMLANGHYQTAKKQLQWLHQSLFYHQWASEQLAILRLKDSEREAQLLQNDDIKRVRSLRYQDNFLFSIGEMGTMFGLLFESNHQNLMALDYFLGQHLLTGNLSAFQQYLPWAQQYGNYKFMPLGYQDVMRCVQNNGKVTGSPYRDYVKRMTGQ